MLRVKIGILFIWAVLIIFPGLLVVFLPSAYNPVSGTDRIPAGLDDIRKRGEITVITRNNAHCYYLYRDTPMGFEYDLAKAFADDLGVRLNIEIAERWEGMIPALQQGKGDFIAASLTITPSRQQAIAFTDGYMAVQQHIIVHREKKNMFQTPEDLADKRVVVRKGTSYEDRLTELQSRGIPLKIRTIPDIPTEELIRRVAEKNIDITIADSNIAMLNRRYYPQAVLAAPISKKEYLGWAVHKRSIKLKNRINDFFWKAAENGTFSNIFDRYYAEVETFDYVDLARFHRRLNTRLPKFQEIIQKAADKYGFDWRLIAAMAYQESHFDPRAKSSAYAYGLMQLTRRTAESLGVDNIFDPRENVEAGVHHLKKLYDFYDKAEGEDRLFIALAAYNIGRGHILDARNLARQQGLNPDKWHSLEQTLPLLEYRKYYINTEYGYCRGRQPIEYLERINIYYDILKRKEITSAAPDVGESTPIRADLSE